LKLNLGVVPFGESSILRALVPPPKLDYTIGILMGETLKRCPNLRKLQLTSLHDSTFRREFMTSFVKLVRQFSHVDIQFVEVE